MGGDVMDGSEEYEIALCVTCNDTHCCSYEQGWS